VGDIVRGASLVVWAIRDGRECAEAILERFGTQPVHAAGDPAANVVAAE
jgi:glutamate synthase (NADPH/NADH) small chain